MVPKGKGVPARVRPVTLATQRRQSSIESSRWRSLSPPLSSREASKDCDGEVFVQQRSLSRPATPKRQSVGSFEASSKDDLQWCRIGDTGDSITKPVKEHYNIVVRPGSRQIQLKMRKDGRLHGSISVLSHDDRDIAIRLRSSCHLVAMEKGTESCTLLGFDDEVKFHFSVSKDVLGKADFRTLYFAFEAKALQKKAGVGVKGTAVFESSQEGEQEILTREIFFALPMHDCGFTGILSPSNTLSSVQFSHPDSCDFAHLEDGVLGAFISATNMHRYPVAVHCKVPSNLFKVFPSTKVLDAGCTAVFHIEFSKSNRRQKSTIGGLRDDVSMIRSGQSLYFGFVCYRVDDSVEVDWQSLHCRRPLQRTIVGGYADQLISLGKDMEFMKVPPFFSDIESASDEEDLSNASDTDPDGKFSEATSISTGSGGYDGLRRLSNQSHGLRRQTIDTIIDTLSDLGRGHRNSVVNSLTSRGNRRSVDSLSSNCSRNTTSLLTERSGNSSLDTELASVCKPISISSTRSTSKGSAGGLQRPHSLGTVERRASQGISGLQLSKLGEATVSSGSSQDAKLSVMPQLRTSPILSPVHETFGRISGFRKKFIETSD